MLRICWPNLPTCLLLSAYCSIGCYGCHTTDNQRAIDSFLLNILHLAIPPAHKNNRSGTPKQVNIHPGTLCPWLKFRPLTTLISLAADQVPPGRASKLGDPSN